MRITVPTPIPGPARIVLREVVAERRRPIPCVRVINHHLFWLMEHGYASLEMGDVVPTEAGRAAMEEAA